MRTSDKRLLKTHKQRTIVDCPENVVGVHTLHLACLIHHPDELADQSEHCIPLT